MRISDWSSDVCSSDLEDKILPAAVVNDLLGKKLAEMEQREGRKPGGRARKRLKEDLVHELLPRAFVKPSRTDAVLDLEHGLCIVDSSSRKSAERSEEHTSELQSLMRNSYAVFCLKKK